jgi:SAM-dependent methyltransferase
LSSIRRHVVRALKNARGIVLAAFYRGDARHCPVCGSSARIFRSGGITPRPDVECPRCGALERHRFEWVFLTRCTNLFDGSAKTVLHIAPEACFERELRARLGTGYLTADLRRAAMVRMDITDIQYPDESFDVVLCSHVLEHVPEDRRALGELFRVTRRGGWALLLVPLRGDVTFEDAAIDDPAARMRAFGHDDHVRWPGLDYAERMREAGFDVDVVRSEELLTPEEEERMRVRGATLFYCRRRAADSSRSITRS